MHNCTAKLNMTFGSDTHSTMPSAKRTETKSVISSFNISSNNRSLFNRNDPTL